MLGWATWAACDWYIFRITSNRWKAIPKEKGIQLPKKKKQSVSLVSHDCLRLQYLQVPSRYFMAMAIIINFAGPGFLISPESKILKMNCRDLVQYLPSPFKGQHNMFLLLMMGPKLLLVIYESKPFNLKLKYYNSLQHMKHAKWHVWAHPSSFLVSFVTIGLDSLIFQSWKSIGNCPQMCSPFIHWHASVCVALFPACYFWFWGNLPSP